MSNAVFAQGISVDLMMMLETREQRSLTQRELFAKNRHASLLSATMNIPGPIKTSPILRNVFEEVMDVVRQHPSIQAAPILTTLYREKVTGPEYYMLLDLPAEVLKKAMIDIEQQHPWGRLLDLDVLYCESREADSLQFGREEASAIMTTEYIHSISRTDLNLPTRRCLICEEDAKVCGRSRTHSVEEMQAAIAELIENEREKVND
ncbi:citrate lyase holo-[acyl-carrier protein] synthase [Aerococcaceae bacterium WS4759]|uniref:citrate lyase holo-[acyl-carrier protein] synthase n=1 Tax=Fundicoccus ignavus TaxID=2664442 RepID=A0A6I2GL66_9LACT|nr:citrate lyase holo-[acyl-carrier protein] synthase [Fundicoccus ignavus]MRI84345.1 citrate lyase holo-[acyl-carrier protein] synthase [Fundicoccus ignavus]